MESGQATPQGSSPYRASLEQEKSPWKDSLQQVTGYSGRREIGLLWSGLGWLSVSKKRRLPC